MGLGSESGYEDGLRNAQLRHIGCGEGMDGGEAKADRAGLGRAAPVISGKSLGRAIIAGRAVNVAEESCIEAGRPR